MQFVITEFDCTVVLIRDLLKTSADQIPIPIGGYSKILKLNISLSLINLVLFRVEHDLPITIEKFEKFII
jgi:hypothetical protein